MRDVVAAAERGAGPPPAALLDAGDGDRQLRASLDEHGHVEDPVLLRADELLAVVEQHPCRRVGLCTSELRHRAGVGGLVDTEAARERLVEGDVLRDRVAEGEERGDDDPAVLHGLAELEGLDVAWRSPLVLLESAARGHVLTGRAAS